MIAVIDYGLGNIRSLMNWLDRGGLQAVLTDDVKVIESADLLILPGVGAYADAVERLANQELDQVIKTLVLEGKPIVGICLGMQLLYEVSFEGGEYKGLGLLPGKVVPFDNQRVKVPQMGWNQLTSRDGRFNQSYVYFIHSYYVSSDFQEVVAYTQYDVKVPAIVRRDNVLGFQFHPEKSGSIGEKMICLIKEMKNEYLSGC